MRNVLHTVVFQAFLTKLDHLFGVDPSQHKTDQSSQGKSDPKSHIQNTEQKHPVVLIIIKQIIVVQLYFVEVDFHRQNILVVPLDIV
jgi:hypothetical protein